MATISGKKTWKSVLEHETLIRMMMADTWLEVVGKTETSELKQLTFISDNVFL